MKYINSDFLHENLIIRRTPVTAAEAYNKLICLQEIEAKHNNGDMFKMFKPSKRRDRLTKIFWAFRRMEGKA